MLVYQRVRVVQGYSVPPMAMSKRQNGSPSLGLSANPDLRQKQTAGIKLLDLCKSWRCAYFSVYHIWYIYIYIMYIYIYTYIHRNILCLSCPSIVNTSILQYQSLQRKLSLTKIDRHADRQKINRLDEWSRRHTSFKHFGFCMVLHNTPWVPWYPVASENGNGKSPTNRKKMSIAWLVARGQIWMAIISGYVRVSEYQESEINILRTINTQINT